MTTEITSVVQATVATADLKAALDTVLGAIEKSNNIPILNNVLVNCEAGLLALRGTNLDVGIRALAPATVSAPGIFTVHARRLARALAVAPGLFTTLDLGADDVCRLTSDELAVSLPTMAPDAFPLWVEGEIELGRVSADVFARLTSSVIRCVTAEDTRYFLDGGRIVLDRESCESCATDGHRLAIARGPATAPGRAEILIGRRAWLALGDLCAAHPDKTLVLRRSKTHTSYQLGQVVVTERIVESKFPPAERVVPKGNPECVLFDRAELLAAIGRVAFLAHRFSPALYVTLSDGRIHLVCKTEDDFKASTHITAFYTGPVTEIVLNHRYLTDLLEVTTAGRMEMRFRDAMSQVLMEPAGEDRDCYTAVLMPMRM